MIVGLTLPSGSLSEPCVLESWGAEVWGTHPEHKWLIDQPGRPELPTSARPRALRPERVQTPRATRSRLDQEIAAGRPRCFSDRTRIQTVLPLRKVWARSHRQVNSSGLPREMNLSG